jgi:hypothetical protein
MSHAPRADELLIKPTVGASNPLDNPENYERIVHVIKDGQIIDRDRLPEHPILTQTG